jgi:hypothetical protein
MAAGPLMPWLYAHFPKYVTSTEQIGRAIIKVAKQGAAQSIFENSDINKV